MSTVVMSKDKKFIVHCWTWKSTALWFTCRTTQSWKPACLVGRTIVQCAMMVVEVAFHFKILEQNNEIYTMMDMYTGYGQPMSGSLLASWFVSGWFFAWFVGELFTFSPHHPRCQFIALAVSYRAPQHNYIINQIMSSVVMSKDTCTNLSLMLM